MIVSIADRIRKLASLIERDNTPSDSSIGDRKMLQDSVVDAEGEIVNSAPRVPIKKKLVSVETEAQPQPTAPPMQRRPRKQPDHLNKWNSTTSTGLMKEYMQNYRAEGKDVETDGPKSTYKKKFKV
jgi:hypothetical protein